MTSQLMPHHRHAPLAQQTTTALVATLRYPKRVSSHVSLAVLMVTGALVLMVSSLAFSQDDAKVAATAGYIAPANATTQAPLAMVQTTLFKDTAVYPSTSVGAQVQARNNAQLAAQVGGVVQSWRADTGSLVKRGELLAQLDPRDLSLALAQAQATHQSATAQEALSAQQLKRAQELVAKGFLSPQALQQRETEHAIQQAHVASALAALQTAQRSVSKTRITAPFNAVVHQRMAQVGDMVSPGTPLFNLVDTSKPEVALNVSQTQAVSLERASTIVWRAKDNGQNFPVQLLRIGASLDPQTRSQPVRLRFTSSTDTPLPGSAGELMWNDPQAHMPTQVLVRRAGLVGYFTVVNNEARFVAIPRAQEGRPAPLDLDAQTPIVTSGQALLQNGQAVQFSQ